MRFGFNVVAYIIAEGLVDAARESTTLYVDEPEEKPPEERFIINNFAPASAGAFFIDSPNLV